MALSIARPRLPCPDPPDLLQVRALPARGPPYRSTMAELPAAGTDSEIPFRRVRHRQRRYTGVSRSWRIVPRHFGMSCSLILTAVLLICKSLIVVYALRGGPRSPSHRDRIRDPAPGRGETYLPAPAELLSSPFPAMGRLSP